MKKSIAVLSLVLSVSFVFTPDALWACACGCGVFEVGTSGMLPTQPGGMVSLEYAFQNQNNNWHRYATASNDDNADKQIRTNYVTTSIRSMFNRSWGVMADLPFVNRYFTTTDSNGGPTSFMHSGVGDIRVRAIYSGFSADMSTGLTFGLKLPTGDFVYPNFDRDTQIGTGSTDVLFGAYHMGHIAATENWNWFFNGQLDAPALSAGGYRPGSEINASLGAYYDRWRLGTVKVAPLGQVIAAHRWRDAGTFGHSPDTGFDRVFLSPGLELDAAGVKVYGDVGFPVYQYMNGNQLVSSTLLKLKIGYAF